MTAHDTLGAERVRYVALAVATIALGLWVHRGMPTLNPEARDVIGDALWAAMMTWWVSAVAPRATRVARAAVVDDYVATGEGTRAVFTSTFDSAEDLQKVLDMGIEEGATSAINQIDGFLARADARA